MTRYRQPRRADDRKAAAELFALQSTRTDAEKRATLIRSYALKPTEADAVLARVKQGRLT